MAGNPNSHFVNTEGGSRQAVESPLLYVMYTMFALFASRSDVNANRRYFELKPNFKIYHV